MLADVVKFRRRYCSCQKSPPVAVDDRKQGFYVYQFIILTGYMGGSAAPAPLLRLSNQFCANRVVYNNLYRLCHNSNNNIYYSAAYKKRQFTLRNSVSASSQNAANV